MKKALDRVTNMSLAFKIPALVAAAALLSVVSVGLMNYFKTANALHTEAEIRYEAMVDSRAEALYAYLSSIREDLKVTASNGTVVEALAAFERGFAEIDREGRGGQVLQDL
ncbi:MAG: hypothetical protein ACK4OG_14450, partial [Parvibaculum sp.]